MFEILAEWPIEIVIASAFTGYLLGVATCLVLMNGDGCAYERNDSKDET